MEIPMSVDGVVRCPACSRVVGAELQACPGCNASLGARCPYCSEDIKPGARKCPHCKEFLDGQLRDAEHQRISANVSRNLEQDDLRAKIQQSAITMGLVFLPTVMMGIIIGPFVLLYVAHYRRSVRRLGMEPTTSLRVLTVLATIQLVLGLALVVVFVIAMMSK